jgi:hypothetical protein
LQQFFAELKRSIPVEPGKHYKHEDKENANFMLLTVSPGKAATVDVQMEKASKS